jgi:8-oxo-dGTP pyrophosphatase MutT (NUDIX family)
MDPWTPLSDRHEGNYRVFDVHRRRLQSPRSGRTADFFVIDAPDWVNVIPLTADDEVVCVRQYRAGTDTVTLEIPGGMVDPEDSDTVTAGRRELLEETGYDADRFVDLGFVEPNPAIQSNQCGTVLAVDAHPVGPQQLDGSEEIDLEHVPLADIPALILQGTITHALVVAGFYRFEHWRRAHPDA